MTDEKPEQPSLRLPLDLSDPETANEVADAIRRFHPDRYVPLSERYPWEFPNRDVVQPGPCPAQLVLQVIEPDGAGGLHHRPERHVCTLLATHAGLHTDDVVTWADALEMQPS